MAYNHITFEKKGKLGTITLNTPPSNWLTINMMKEINDALMDVKKDRTLKMLVFDHGGEKAFCERRRCRPHGRQGERDDRGLPPDVPAHVGVGPHDGGSSQRHVSRWRLRADEFLRHRYRVRPLEDRPARNRRQRLSALAAAWFPKSSALKRPRGCYLPVRISAQKRRRQSASSMWCFLPITSRKEWRNISPTS